MVSDIKKNVLFGTNRVVLIHFFSVSDVSLNQIEKNSLDFEQRHKFYKKQSIFHYFSSWNSLNESDSSNERSDHLSETDGFSQGKRDAGNPILNKLSKATSAIYGACKRPTGTSLQS